MTILRPCIDSSLAKGKKPDTGKWNLELMRQEAADHFWAWAEERISVHTDHLCSLSVKLVSETLTTCRAGDPALRIIMTQSAPTLAAESPFDRLCDYLSLKGMTPVRISGSGGLTMESVQLSLLSAALGVSGSVAFGSKSRTGVSVKGLDLSILEDADIGKDIVVIVEEGDAVDKSILRKVIELVFFLNEKLQDRGNFASLVVESNLGESLVEEVLDEESLFSNISVSVTALIDARELSAKIRSVFFGPSSEKNLVGFPIEFADQESRFLAKQLPAMSLSPMELCEHALVMTRTWFKDCRYSFLAGCIVGCLGSARDDETASRIEYDTDKVRSQIKLSGKVSVFQELLMNNLHSRQRLAILSRILRNVSSAVTESSIHTDSIIDQLTATRFIASSEDALLDKLIDRCLGEIRSRKKDGRTPDAIVSDTVRMNEKLIEMLSVELGISKTSGAIDSIEYLNEQIRPLANQRFNQTKLFDEFFSTLRSFLRKNFLVLFSHDPTMAKQQEQVHSLFVLESQREDALSNVGCFDDFVAFLRSDGKSPTLQTGLKQVFQVSRLIYGPNDKKAKKAKSTHNLIDLDLITDRLGKDMSTLELAEALASLEYIGLIRPPGFVDMSHATGSVKVRKIYKDTALVGCGSTADGLSEEEEEEE